MLSLQRSRVPQVFDTFDTCVHAVSGLVEAGSTAIPRFMKLLNANYFLINLTIDALI